MTDPVAATLYLVGTPIGNRDDLTPRALETLRRVELVACEDTRRCRHLFDWLGLPVPNLIRYDDHVVETALPRIMEPLSSGVDVALVADAGMPAVQDPGYRLVHAARERGIRVVPIAGPSALLLALAASGLPTDRFVFLGFAPRSGREAWWRSALERNETVIVYESARRVDQTLAVIELIDPARRIVLAREITKIHEEFPGGVAGALRAELDERREPLRGECVLLVDRAPEAPLPGIPWREAARRIDATRAARGLSARDRIELLAALYPNQRNAIYREIATQPDD